ncbi:MAG: hypothetical protein E7312_04865 [Clostridiales bacterium]|nr:hypothetical protein [Clostridiales bacterium]
MKKYIMMFAFVVCVAAAVCTARAKACVVPIISDESSNTAGYLQSVELESLRLELRPTESNYYATTLEFSVKNTTDAALDVTMGIPQYFYSTLSKISSLSVNFKGKSAGAKLTDIAKAADHQSGDPYYNTVYVWTSHLEAGEIGYFRATFTVSTRADSKGMEYVDLPLKALRYWGDGKTSLNVTLDSTMLNIYSYDRTPSIRPTLVESTGALVWHLNEFDAKSNLTAYYNSDTAVITKYFNNMFTSGNEKQAADLFRAKRYYEAVAFIDSNEALSNNLNLRFMKMICLEKLGDEVAAKALLSELFDEEVCFSSNTEFDLSEYVKKRMIFAYYNNAKASGAADSLLEEILTTGLAKLTESKSSLFIDWANTQRKSLTLSPSNPNVGGSQQGSNTKPPEQSGELTVKQWLKQLSEPAVVTVGAVLVVVVIFCLVGMKNEKKKKPNKYSKY